MMKKLMNALVISGLCFLGSLTNVEAAKFDVAIEHDKIVTLTGFIKDEPRKRVSEDGLYETYFFDLAAGSGIRGDDYVTVTYKSLIGGYKVGEMTPKKGDKVTLTGKIKKAPDGIPYRGDFFINDYLANDLSKFPKK